MLVRSWNLFNGNTRPTGRRDHLDEMMRLATGDGPDLLCVQEVPAWALPRFTVGDVAARPSLGPLPVSPSIGKLLTQPNHGLLRSLFAGQGNAVAVGAGLELLDHRVDDLNPNAFRKSEAHALGLDLVERLAWAKERRVMQTLRLRTSDGRTIVCANLHCTSARDGRIPMAELERAAELVLARAAGGEIVLLAGDFNVDGRTPALADLIARHGLSAPGPGIDHILVRGAVVTELRVWPSEQRALPDGTLLSDHAPVELEIL